jgi:hypothetical protein
MQTGAANARSAAVNIAMTRADRARADKVAAIIGERVLGLMGFAAFCRQWRNYRAFVTGSFKQPLNFLRS